MALFDKLRFWRRADGGGTATTTHATRSAVSYAMPLADASSHYAVYAAWSLQYRASLSVNLQIAADGRRGMGDCREPPRSQFMGVWQRRGQRV